MDQTISLAISALPGIASKPLAIGAFLMVVASWTFIAFRVRRNKQLLSRLRDLPAADRLPALIAEMGKVSVREGLSAEHYLAERRYSYYFWALLVFCLLIVVVLSLRAYSQPNDNKEVAVDVTTTADFVHAVNPTALQQLSGEPITILDYCDAPSNELELSYAYDRQGPEIQVSSNIPYFRAGDRGEEVAGISKPIFPWSFPTLELKILNPTHETVYISELEISVTSSAIISAPQLIVCKDTRNSLEFINAGWGRVLNPRLFFRVSPYQDSASSLAAESNTEITTSIPSFDGVAGVPLDSTMLPSKLSSSGSNRLALLSNRVSVTGHLDYTTESGLRRRLNFRTAAYLGPEFRRLEACLVPSTVRCVFLKAGKSRYRIRLPYSQVVKEDDVDALGLVLLSDKSCKTHVTLTLRTVSGAVFKQLPVSIELFVPSCCSRYKVELPTVP